jgi:hypothetical protein
MVSGTAKDFNGITEKDIDVFNSRKKEKYQSCQRKKKKNSSRIPQINLTFQHEIHFLLWRVEVTSKGKEKRIFTSIKNSCHGNQVNFKI